MHSMMPDTTLPIAALAAPCPEWCTVVHTKPDLVDDIDGSQGIEHRATVLADAGGHLVELQQWVDVAADGTVTADPVQVVVDGRIDEAAPIAETRTFLAGLALACGVADAADR